MCTWAVDPKGTLLIILYMQNGDASFHYKNHFFLLTSSILVYVVSPFAKLYSCVWPSTNLSFTISFYYSI